MLRSSGFFCAVDCPFGPACGRPYCPFRHPPGQPCQTRLFPAQAGPKRRLAAASSECGYDPYNPQLPKPSAQSSNGVLEDAAESAPSILELELVNKAIEAVQNEVAREQKKYEELLETTKEYGSPQPALLAPKVAGSASVKKANASLEYSPGSYKVNSNADYNPTPLAAVSRSSKYTLDCSGHAKPKGSSLEYVPTAVNQPKKYSSSSTNSKYIIDNSKPSTDLEYDPLLNYSARLLNKAGAKEQKGTKRKRNVNCEEVATYRSSFKRRCDVASSYEPVAKFSDSEEEEDAKCQVASSIRLKSGDSSERKLRTGSVSKEKESQLEDVSSRQMKETAVQYDMGDIESPQKGVVKDLLGKTVKLAHSDQDGKEERSKGAHRDKLKKKKIDSPKAEGKRAHDIMADKEKTITKRKNGERIKEKCDQSVVDKPLKKASKVKSGKLTGGKEEPSGKSKTDRSGKLKAGNGQEDCKLRSSELKSGQEASRGKYKDRKDKLAALERPKKKLAGSLGRGTAEAKPKGKQRAPSHVDLFGDESGDEGQAGLTAFLNVSSDSDGEGSYFPLPSSNGFASVKRSRPLSAAAAASSSSSSSSSDEVDYSGLEKDLDFESDPMEECLRIFNESTTVKTEDKGRLGKQLSREEVLDEKITEDNLTTLFPGQKRRISHVTKQGSAESPSKPVVRPYRPPTAQEVCYQRIQLAQQQAAQLARQQLSTPPPPAPPRPPLALHKGGKKRIAHVPNTPLSMAAKGGPMNPKTAVPPGRAVLSGGADALSLKARTLAGMASKTTCTNVPKRIAHAPTLQSATLQRPVIPTEFGAKVPTNIRQRYLHLFIDECLKSCASQQEAFDKLCEADQYLLALYTEVHLRLKETALPQVTQQGAKFDPEALSEEKVAYERSTSRNIYLNVAVNTLKKLRSLVPSPGPSSSKASNRKVVSHEAMLGGKLAAKTSFTLSRSNSLRAEDLTGAALYRRLKEYLMTEEQLKENSYPMPCPEKPGRVIVFTTEEKKSSDGSCRVCCRCGTEYMVTPSGNCVRKEECVHHWGRLRKQRVPGGWETHYNCCSGAVGSPGCQVAKQHVQDGRKENLEGFVKTFEKLPGRDGSAGIYALDCEMCYTKQGLELTRVTVINSDLKVVYDTFVKPDHKVVDYNTRFSGVTEADLENTSITLRDVQAVLLNMFSEDTILIGHSLESDLFALKLIHGTVVDTAIVFPHRLGFPYKRALRTLMADYLKRIIQDSVDGHDSSEDARACMELMIWKIKEDAKVKR